MQIFETLPQTYPLLFPILCLILLILFPALLILLFRTQKISARAEKTADSEQKIAVLQQENTTLQVQLAKFSTQLSAERRAHEEKLSLLNEAKERLGLQFQELAQRIFEEKNERFGRDSRERLSSVLTPLQNQLQDFRKRMDSIQDDALRERASLKTELQHLRDLNREMGKEAHNLTEALRGDQKKQGLWGEMVLERLLEVSGLREGEEFAVQSSFRNDGNHLLRPDVVVYLPGNRQIIVDAKVSLTAWERFCNSSDEQEKGHQLKEHLLSIRKHIKELGDKNYPEIPNITSLDFVLLFLPIDASLSEAVNIEPGLFTEAYKQRVILVTPTTLLVTLRTVENLWRSDRQSRNAQEIATAAGQMYDKFCSFTEEMEKLGRQLTACTTVYESASRKLSTGRGNLISQAQKLADLGAPTRKALPQDNEKD